MIEPLSMNRGIAPKDSKRPRTAFLPSMNALNLWDCRGGSWSQCSSDFRKWRLSVNLTQKAGASWSHSKRCRALPKVTELREAFGVRPACWRFRFIVPRRVAGNVAANHEPGGRAGCPHPAAGLVECHGWSRRGEDTAPYPPRAVHGPNARPMAGGGGSPRNSK